MSGFDFKEYKVALAKIILNVFCIFIIKFVISKKGTTFSDIFIIL